MTNSLPPSNNAPPAEVIRLGHYELLDCIGRGGMGLVYRARDTRLDRQVAIKCLRTELFEAHYVERFKREALLLAKLNHPNIVQIYDFIEAPDQLALVMELVEGQNLQLHLREHIVPFAQRMRWLAEIAQGLAVAHDAGIIHRDLKAENILINQRKVAKITDLGIAKSQDFNGTLTDHVAGSYCSMSPEQAMGETIDFKSDLFSFGILAYQLLCGAHPFGDTNNKLQIMQRIISHPPIAPSKHNPNLPVEINDLLGQLLSKDPAKRPDNTHWVAAQFEKLSHLQPANDFVSDDTQALIPNGTAANQSSVKNSGIRSATRTQDHPTFETRFIAVEAAKKKSPWLPIKNYLIENKISAGLGLFSVLIIAAVVIWQLQPKPPKYIAVIPPKLIADGMQESQQELVKGAVYNAILQSVIQLDGYYVIPRSEITDVNGDRETVHRATAADELIAAEISCKIESCTIVLERLVAEKNNPDSRLRIESSNSTDVLTDNYLSIAEITQRSLESFYSNDIITRDDGNLTEQDYTTFIEVNAAYLASGASESSLEKLESLSKNAASALVIQTLYRDISLDLFYETGTKIYIDKLTNYLKNSTHQNNNEKVGALINEFHLKLAENDNNAIEKIIYELSKLDMSDAKKLELLSVAAIHKADYKKAITLLQKAIQIKPTANFYYNTALSYWYLGETTQAENYLALAAKIAPTHHKLPRLRGIIALNKGDLNTAINAFEELIKIREDDTLSMMNLGLSHMLNRDYSEAEKILTKANLLAPDYTTLILNLADSKNLLGKKTDAENLYRNVLVKSVMAESPTDLRNKAQALSHLNEHSAAISIIQELQKIDAQDVETSYTAAIVYTQANEQTSAVLNIDKALKKNLNNIWFNFSWFDSLCKNTQYIKIMSAHGNPNRCDSHAQ